MEENLQAKQTYLRKQIVDKGYNPEAFLEYIKTLRDEGQDINVWSMQQLQWVVQQYKKVYARSSKLGSQIEQQQQEKNKKLFKQCKKYERFLERDFGNVQVTIQKPQIVTLGGFMGFGATNVLWYSLKTSIVGNEVRRADTDFDWLQSTLVRLHPNRVIPPLAKSKPISPDDTKALFKRGQMIKLFIQGLSKCEPLINCKLTVAFLTWGDYPRFQAFKKQQTTIMSPISPIQFVSQSGNIEVQISQQNSTVVKSINTYNNNVKQVYNEIKQNIEQVSKNFQDLTASIYRIGNSFATLQQKHSDLITSIPQFNDELYNQMMIGLNNCIIEWGRTFNNRRKAVEKHLSLMFQYTMQQSQMLERTLKKRQTIQDDYKKMRIFLHKKRQKLSVTNPVLNKIQIPYSINQKIQALGQISKEDFHHLIPITQLKNQNDLRQMLGSINTSCKTQFIRLQPVIKQRFLLAFKSMGKGLLQNNKSQTEVIMRLINGEY